MLPHNLSHLAKSKEEIDLNPTQESVLQDKNGPTLYLESSRIMVLQTMVEHAINDSYQFDKTVHFSQENAPTRKTGDKTVFFIRHGQSTANVQLMEILAQKKEDPGTGTHWEKHKDSRLTQKGLDQARALQDLVASFNVHTVVTSPLRRTLFTASNAFASVNIPIIAWPVLTEFYPDGWENKGMKLSEVAEELTTLPRPIIMDACEDEWWTPALSGDITRVNTILSWIAHCPESRIAIVCHYGIIREFLRLVGFNDVFSPKNCSPVECHFSTAPPRPKHMQYKVKLMLSATQPKTQFLDEVLSFYEECQIDSKLQCATQLGPLHITIADFWPLSDEDLSEVIEALQRFSEDVKEKRGSWRADKHTLDIVVEDGNVLFAYILIISKTITALSNNLKRLPCYENSPVVRANHTATLMRDDKPMGKSFHLMDFSEKIDKYELIRKMIYDKDETWKEDFGKLSWKIVISSPLNDKMAFPL